MACIVRIIVPGYPLHITQPSQISIAFVRRWILGEEFGSKKHSCIYHVLCNTIRGIIREEVNRMEKMMSVIEDSIREIREKLPRRP